MLTIGKTCRTGEHARVLAILGSQWGDEGKGKLTDLLADKFDIIARFNGGDNAGHTIVVKNLKFAFHMLPSGMLNERTMNVIGNGVVVNLKSLLDEVKSIEKAGVSWKNRLAISDRAHLVLKSHIDADISQEVASKDKMIGTTKKGIGPTYGTKARRTGLRVHDLEDWELFTEKYSRCLRSLGKTEADYPNELDEIKQLRDIIIENKMIHNTSLLLHNAYKNQKRILAEGANGLLLDIDHGTYPYVTSSSTAIGGLMTGLGFPPQHVDSVIGIAKAYVTRVGSGPFPTECLGEESAIGQDIRKRGAEFGATTGRPRRVGWFDVNVMKYSNMINGYSSLNLTKLDILSSLNEIKIGVGYRKPDGTRYEGIFPASLEELSQLKPEYEVHPGWGTDISKVTSYDKLPKNCISYVERLEKLTGVPISWIGVGPERNSMILKPKSNI